MMSCNKETLQIRWTFIKNTQKSKKDGKQNKLISRKQTESREKDYNKKGTVPKNSTLHLSTCNSQI